MCPKEKKNIFIFFHKFLIYASVNTNYYTAIFFIYKYTVKYVPGEICNG